MAVILLSFLTMLREGPCPGPGRKQAPEPGHRSWQSPHFPRDSTCCAGDSWRKSQRPGKVRVRSERWGALIDGGP